jgi:hypothetical protein
VYVYVYVCVFEVEVVFSGLTYRTVESVFSLCLR